MVRKIFKGLKRERHRCFHNRTVTCWRLVCWCGVMKMSLDFVQFCKSVSSSTPRGMVCTQLQA